MYQIKLLSEKLMRYNTIFFLKYFFEKRWIRPLQQKQNGGFVHINDFDAVNFIFCKKKKKISLSENFFLPPDFPKGSEKDEYDRFKKISKWNVRC